MCYDTTEQTRFAEVFMPHLVDAFGWRRLAGSRRCRGHCSGASMRAFKA
jgi:hypothetical protein